jgi:hypothetical protein
MPKSLVYDEVTTPIETVSIAATTHNNITISRNDRLAFIFINLPQVTPSVYLQFCQLVEHFDGSLRSNLLMEKQKIYNSVISCSRLYHRLGKFAFFVAPSAWEHKSVN